MSDLISRERVIDTLKQSGIIVDNVRGNLIIEEINRIPTAYDVDKVVERLEAEKEESYQEEYFAYGNGVKFAIDVVKGGGQG